jgi:LPS-assembly lipoprotein
MRMAVVAALLAALGGCGFKPMYSQSSMAQNGGAAIGSVEIDEVEGKAGHAFRQAMVRLLDAERGSGVIRRLKVTIKERLIPLGLRTDASSTRSDMELTADYQFFDSNGALLFSGATVAMVSYNIPVGAYAEISAQNDARARGGQLLAERMRTDLALRVSALNAKKT